MCGIVGVVGSRESIEELPRMLSELAPRGPDAEGTRRIELGNGRYLALGHRRLAILDLSEGGAQPMEGPRGQCVITYNGELYNYVEVREELIGLGATFRSDSDTEVLLQAYQVWGRDCLAKFNGMFAFAIYDAQRRVLFCARDRLGEKPFLYFGDDTKVVFASEYKALLQHREVPCDVDEMRLLQAAHRPSTGLDADQDTVFRGVKQLLPGEAMEVGVGDLQIETWQYWSPQSNERTGLKAEDVFHEFRELLIDSVRLRMRSDVEVGSCLSGGLDSSAIVCIARNLLGADVEYHTFTGCFPGTSADEWEYAQQVVAATGVRAHVVEPTVDGFLADLPEFVWANELPVASSSQYAQWCVFRLAKEQGITVLLDGQGADEVLGGYEQYFASYVESLKQRGESARLAAELPEIRKRYPLALPTAQRALRDRLPFRVRHWLSNRMRVGTGLLYGMRVDVAQELIEQQTRQSLSGGDPLRRSLTDDTFGGFLTTLLRYGDRNSMAHSREVRLPFCDHRIPEFVLGLPPHLLMGEVQTKRLLRESMRGILPEGIRTRWNKQGFRPPQDLWFQSSALLSHADEMMHSAEFRSSGLWIPEWWESALSRVRSGELQLGWQLFQPLMIHWWREHFLRRIQMQRAQAD